MDENSPKLGTSTIGRGHAELPIPFYIKSAKFFTTMSLWLFLMSLLLFLQGWGFLEHGFSSGLTTRLLILGVISLISTVVISSHVSYKILFAIKTRPDGPPFYTGFESKTKALIAILATPAVLLLTISLLSFHFKKLPVPTTLEVHQISTRKSNPDLTRFFPVFFWDYSTWIDPDVFKDFEIFIPYEKGPPDKLLSRLIFRNKKSGDFALELHGRRPRNYNLTEVDQTFHKLSNEWSIKTFIEKLPLLYKLQKEAGIIDKDGFLLTEKPPALNLFIFDANFRIIGLPWEELLSGDIKSHSGRFFFLNRSGNDNGDVFQARCPNPCILSDVLARIEFPEDPRGSIKARVEFTAMQVRKTFESFKPESDPLKRELLETRLKLYLVSLITLNPQDPEGFFHLGMLTTSKDTLTSLIQYGKDVRMDKSRLIELETRLSQM